MATITMNRPEDRNPASTRMLNDITRLFRALAENEAVRVVIITGAGKAFSAGGDFQHFVATAQDPAVARATLDNSRDYIRAILDLPIPLIAAVNGAAVGFGATLVALSDIVLMADSAFIAEPHVNVGLVIGDGISISWPFLMPLNRVKELVFTGDRILAADCVAYGLANRAMPLVQLLPEAMALAERIAKQPRSAVAGSKAILNMYPKAVMDTVLEAQLARQFDQTQGPDHGRIVQGLIDRQKRKSA
ncbi:enoyl-CoA hydratase/isomerase family protein [Novosphingobium cyanobacteriorum]|uniref:Enoyl-CoA hydratase/isomerase family protein n=1 Tax=Novosphingobium cyanobacteriorum TaxID=3024215 RepID=A0ABT6CQ13_9SPHN|nr:enoyl-CoA hydratase/isomerase family protein [Novosphingobium cyanobacteriorum]MDF8335313.1 enoyl-CoA hydratase/isomerase family protein [Novosphingobium cyanobacteriorum]